MKNKCTFCPRPATTNILAVGPNGRRQYPACEKCAAERRPTPKLVPPFAVRPDGERFAIIYSGLCEVAIDWFDTQAEAEARAAELTDLADNRLAHAGMIERREPHP